MSTNNTTNDTEIKSLTKSQLVAQYSPLVRSIVSKIKKTLPAAIDFEDLVQYGIMGLLEAADRFDAAKNASFITFAYYRIRGAVYDGLRDMGYTKRSGSAHTICEGKVSDFMEDLDSTLLNQINNMSAQEAARRLTAIVNNLATIYITSLDANEALQIADPKSVQADEYLANTEVKKLLHKALISLNQQERQLIDMYYYQNKSLEEVGQTLGLSKSWTSRLHSRIIEKLNRLLEQQLDV